MTHLVSGPELTGGMTLVGYDGGHSRIYYAKTEGLGEGTRYLSTEHGLLVIDADKSYTVALDADREPTGWEGTD